MPDFRYVEMMKALLQDPELLRKIVESNELMRMGPQRREPSGPTEQDLSQLEAALMESIGRYGSFEKGMPPGVTPDPYDVQVRHMTRQTYGSR